jgi:hypothetical protein
MTTTALIARIKQLQVSIHGFEGEIALKFVEIGEHLRLLKRAANGSWSQQLAVLGYHERVARRFMAIAASWWADGGLRETGLHTQLPVDLEKLEWLSKLTQGQLQEGLANWDVHAFTRSQLTLVVKKKLNRPQRAKPKRPVSVDQLREELQSYIRRWLDRVEEHSNELADPDVNRELLEDIQTTVAEVQDTIASVRDEDPEEVDAEGTNGTTQGVPPAALTGATMNSIARSEFVEASPANAHANAPETVLAPPTGPV